MRIPTHNENWSGNENSFEKLLNENGKNEPTPVYLEHDTPNYYLNREMKSEETTE